MKTLALITEMGDMNNLVSKLKENFNIYYAPNCTEQELINDICDSSIIFTNPNNQKFPLNSKVLSKLRNLETIVTASTGTVHIDMKYCKQIGIKVISIKDELETLQKITSTAEHAVLLTLTAVRKTHLSMDSVKSGIWDYQPYIGRQINCLKVGSVGFGRLGKIYLDAMHGMGASCYYSDPYVTKVNNNYGKIGLQELFRTCDVVALNCHVSEQTKKLINSEILHDTSVDVLVNTSRGEIVNIEHLFAHMEKFNDFIYATDVISNEQDRKARRDFLKYFEKHKEQLIVTPHQGGMTYDARRLAYSRAMELLIEHEFNIK